MDWEIVYDERAIKDLDTLGNVTACRVLKAIEDKLKKDPESVGAPLRKPLNGCRKLRVGDTRIIYQVKDQSIKVIIIAIGPRRNNEAYSIAGSRFP